MSKRILLIVGPQLSRLMIRHEVGFRVEETLTIKKLDEEFFDGLQRAAMLPERRLYKRQSFLGCARYKSRPLRNASSIEI